MPLGKRSSIYHGLLTANVVACLHGCLLACPLQAELGLLDRVAFATKYTVNPCLQAINGEQPCRSNRHECAAALAFSVSSQDAGPINFQQLTPKPTRPTCRHMALCRHKAEFYTLHPPPWLAMAFAAVCHTAAPDASSAIQGSRLPLGCRTAHGP
jgi:hypothetical protein